VRPAIVALICVLSTVTEWTNAGGQEPGGFQCGTGAENTRRVQELGRWVRAREKLSMRPMGAALAAPAVRLVNGVYVMQTDSSITPFDRPMDLLNSSLLFQPAGSDSFTVTKSALAYDTDLGTLFYTFPTSGTASDWHYRSYQLTKFTFPFMGQAFTQFYLSTFTAIFMSPPAFSAVSQPSAAQLVSTAGPVIAPLLNYGGTGSRYLYVKESSDFLAVTWTTQSDGNSLYSRDVQATLYRTGEVRFSYRYGNWGGVLLTSGREAFRDSKAPLLSWSDDPGHVPTTVTDPVLRDLLDIQSVEAWRVGQSPLLEFRITVKGVFDAATLPSAGAQYQLTLEDGQSSDYFRVHIIRTGNALAVDSGQAWAAVEGHTLTWRIADDLLTASAASRTLYLCSIVHTTFQLGEWMSAPITLGTASAALEANLGSLGFPTPVRAPILHAYGLPSLNIDKVWETLKSTYGLTDSDIDGVAVYQNFYTDIILSGASAWATEGVDPVAGVFPNSRLGKAKSPNLMHMNRVSVEGARSSFILRHEFGHRWLYFLQIKESGSNTNSLNPDGAHPAAWVHTPAAFSLVTTEDYSVMGGSRWTDNGNGTFHTPQNNGANGYSWHELYLMGLALPSEAEPWFYIANSNPALASAYNAPVNYTVSGVRKNVVVQQVIDAIGTRTPSAASSQRVFKVLFVLLEHAASQASQEEINQLVVNRANFERDFAPATGNRARLATSPDVDSAPTPQIDSLSPASATVNASGFTLTVNGRGFVSRSVITWNGMARATRFVSSTQLTVAIPDGDLTSAQTAQIAAITPTPGGGYSNTLSFAVNYPVPSLVALYPSVTAAGTTGFTLRVAGANFTPQQRWAYWNGYLRSSTYISPSLLEVSLLDSDLATARTAQVTVENFTGISNALPFSVTSAVTTQGAVAAGSLIAAAGGRLLLPVTLSLNSGITIDSLLFNIQITPQGAAPALTGTPGFVSDSSLPTPVATGSSNGITVCWPPSLTPALSGTKLLGYVTVSVPVSAADGALYSVRVTAAGASKAGAPVPLGNGPNAQVTVRSAGSITLISGNNQSVVFGGALANPLVVRITDSSGNPVAGAGVHFAVTAGAASLSAPWVTTDGNGQAQVTAAGCSQLGSITVSATAVNAGGAALAGSPVQFQATAYAAGSYLIGDVFPAISAAGDKNNDGTYLEAGEFGDESLTILDLIYALRAVTSVPGHRPPTCSDRFDAIDSFPKDTDTARGGDGILNTVDLIYTLRRVTNVDTSRPQRLQRTGPCASRTPGSPATMAARAGGNEAGISGEFGAGVAVGHSLVRVPLFLQLAGASNLAGLSLAVGMSDGQAGAHLRFVPADGVPAPSLIDDRLPGVLALAWLDGLRLPGSRRVLLGYVEVPAVPAGDSLRFYGASANTADGSELRLTLPAPSASHRPR